MAKPIVGLSALTVPDPAVHAVLSRFETEFRNQSFDLYVGDDRRGDVLPRELLRGNPVRQYLS